MRIPGIVRFRTFFCKVTGVVFSVAGGNMRADGSSLVLLGGDGVSSRSAPQHFFTSRLLRSVCGKRRSNDPQWSCGGSWSPSGRHLTTHWQPPQYLSCFSDHSDVTITLSFRASLSRRSSLTSRTSAVTGTGAHFRSAAQTSSTSGSSGCSSSFQR